MKRKASFDEWNREARCLAKEDAMFPKRLSWIRWLASIQFFSDRLRVTN